MFDNEYLLQFFSSEDFLSFSQPFGELTQKIVDELPDSPERSTALRTLLEAKDWVARARLFKSTPE